MASLHHPLGLGEVSTHTCKAGSEENGKRSLGTSQHRRGAASCGLISKRISSAPSQTRGVSALFRKPRAILTPGLHHFHRKPRARPSCTGTETPVGHCATWGTLAAPWPWFACMHGHVGSAWEERTVGGKEHKHHGYIWEQEPICRVPAGAVRCVLFLQAEDAGMPSRGSAMATGLQLHDEDAPAAQDSLLP